MDQLGAELPRLAFVHRYHAGDLRPLIPKRIDGNRLFIGKRNFALHSASLGYAGGRPEARRGGACYIIPNVSAMMPASSGSQAAPEQAAAVAAFLDFVRTNRAAILSELHSSSASRLRRLSLLTLWSPRFWRCLGILAVVFTTTRYRAPMLSS